MALKDGKINLHKTNGIKIAVPVDKMSVEDLEYVERITGQSLDDDKPLSSRSRTSAPRTNAGATIEHPKKPEYDWFQFFLSCEVAVGLCDHYSATFNRDSIDESVLPDVDATVLRTLGIREGDIIKIMRFLDKKYGRTGGKRSVSFGGEDDGEGGLFSGPGGTLRNNTRKGRPAPAVQTNDVVDPKAFSQETPPKPAVHEGVATPLATAPVPEKKDVVRTGFDDDAWDVKPSKQQPAAPSQQSQPAPAPAPAPAPSQPSLTGSMQELSLLTQPLQPVKAQVTAPVPQQTPSEPQGPPAVTPSIFQGIGQQQTGLPQVQQNSGPLQVNLPQNIARQRPAPPQYQNQNPGALFPPAPNRPLSAPLANQASGFAVPPLQAQNTGMPTSGGFQQIAPPGQSLEEIRMRQQQQQQFNAMNGMQNMQNMQNMPNMNMMPQPTGFQYNGMQPNQQPGGFQYPMQTGIQQQQPMNPLGPFSGQPQFLPPQQLQSQPTGFQSSFGQQPQQQFPQPTGINSFLPPALQPTPTGVQNTVYGSTFTPPPVPPIPQQPAAAPLVAQKTGPPPPVRFGVTGDTKKLMPQATGRRANLSQASKSPKL